MTLLVAEDLQRQMVELPYKPERKTSLFFCGISAQESRFRLMSDVWRTFPVTRHLLVNSHY
jgi:hypothetical protein